MFELTFGKFSIARKPIINGGAIRPTGLLFTIFVINVGFKMKVSGLDRGYRGHFSS